MNIQYIGAFFMQLNLTHSPHAVIFILQNRCPVAYPRPHPCEHPNAGQSDTRCSCPQQPPTYLALPFQLSILVQSQGGWPSDIHTVNSMKGVAAMISHQCWLLCCLRNVAAAWLACMTADMHDHQHGFISVLFLPTRPCALWKQRWLMFFLINVSAAPKECLAQK